MNFCATARSMRGIILIFGNIPEFRRNEFGGSLGGPIQKDKTFLFGNYEGFRQNLGLSDLSLVPDAASQGERRSEHSAAAGFVAGGQRSGDSDLEGRAERHCQRHLAIPCKNPRGLWDGESSIRYSRTRIR